MKTWIHRLTRHPETLLTVLALLLVGVITKLDSSFLRLEVQRELSTHIWELALLAIPMTLIILTAGIDLSVGALMGLCAVVVGMTYEAGHSPWIGALAALGVGTLGGFVNGWFISRMRVHPLMITLATLAAYRGIAEGISHARPVSGFPKEFAALGQGSVMGMPIPAWIFIVLMGIALIWLSQTPQGRHCYAIGLNEEASRFSGIPVQRLLLTLYTLSGSAAGLAAVVFVARRNTAKADVGTGMELSVITAVVLGGVSIFGGRGTLIGTCLGLFLLHQTREFVTWHWNREELNWIVLGILLILSVVFQRLFGHKQAS